MIKGIDHIELIVRNFDEYIDFLQKLGFEQLTHTKHHGESAELRPPGENQPIFEIHQASGEEVIGVNHIAFSGPPKLVKETGRTNINLRDPDGWRMQLVDSERKAFD